MRRKGGDASSTAGDAASGSDPDDSAGKSITQYNILKINNFSTKASLQIRGIPAMNSRLPYIRLQFKQRKEHTYG